MSDERDDRMPTPASRAQAKADAAPPVAAPSIEPPSDDVVRPVGDSVLPGAHRGGFHREMTQPLPIAPPMAVHPDASEATAPDVHWIHPPPALPRSAGWALLLGVLALVLSCFVGWGFPVGGIGVVLAVLAVRRPWESDEKAWWAFGLNAASLVFSAGWLWWAAAQGPLFG